MNGRLYVMGTGGFSKEAGQLAHAVNRVTHRWTEIAYLSEDPALVGTCMPYGKVVGTDAMLSAIQEDVDVVIGIGAPTVRRRIACRLRNAAHLHFPNLIHPSAEFDREYVQLGTGNLITAGCVLTCDIAVGDFNVFNLNVTVGHDSVIGSYNVFNPGCNISGNVHVADCCLFGTGSQVIEELSVASNTVLGAGAVLVRSAFDEGTVLTGVPARRRAS